MEINELENLKSQSRKGMLEFCILLLADKEAVYVLDILEKLKTSGLKVAEGTLYPLLNRLKKQGWLTYEWQESKSGPPRKYYRITENGKTALEALHKNWLELNQTIILLKK